MHDLIIENAQNKTRSYTLEIANRLYIPISKLKNAFITVAEKYYAGQIKRFDFCANPVALFQEANEWVSNMTHEMITSVIQASEISTESHLMLLNAIPMMATFGYFPIFEDDEVQVLAMPYEGDENMNMYIILPRKHSSLEDVERSLNGSKMMHYFQNCKASKEFYVRMPKFALESELDLVDVLESMGIIKAFAGIADFTGMAFYWPLFIKQAKHKAVIEVNEEGGEAVVAAAAAAVDEVRNSKFIADHPFLFVIAKDEKDIFFIGRFAG
ncbi:unnamed protein product [Gongylonema pulchrum]|uniref:SERPIN domain-containing protein n=1 Tax=Gongylonema pulchrum TaxID=637853 RepID=A0A183EIT4_9BILA|nr:unnamed protein product [Gongylonema pulchrum]